MDIPVAAPAEVEQERLRTRQIVACSSELGNQSRNRVQSALDIKARWISGDFGVAEGARPRLHLQDRPIGRNRQHLGAGEEQRLARGRQIRILERGEQRGAQARYQLVAGGGAGTTACFWKGDSSNGHLLKVPSSIAEDGYS